MKKQYPNTNLYELVYDEEDLVVLCFLAHHVNQLAASSLGFMETLTRFFMEYNRVVGAWRKYWTTYSSSLLFVIKI